ncbi:VWA domain-containing protein [Variovorax robiniae]|uniref:VWA domain-containing protein n=1 Tax=Variovorax robiniae TaxID=1836199 RepID=A0ABU8XAH5_9BURK
MALTLNLQKSTTSLTLSLQKVGIHKMPVLDMGVVLDVSGSFSDEHADGTTTDLLTRLAPWGLSFDPDKKIDVFTFSNSAASAHLVGSLTEANYQGYVRNNIIEKVPGWCGATDYSYVLELALKEFGWVDGAAKKAGMFGRMFGKKDEPPKQKKRSLIIFITDGDNNDKDRTRKILRESEARKDEVYFLFLGVANGGGAFHFLNSIGDEFGNTGYREIADVRKFVRMSDEEINALLLDDELVGWLKG